MDLNFKEYSRLLIQKFCANNETCSALMPSFSAIMNDMFIEEIHTFEEVSQISVNNFQDHYDHLGNYYLSSNRSIELQEAITYQKNVLDERI